MDGIELEILWSNLVSAASEQARALQRIAFSPVVREAGDLACALLDRKGRMIAQAVTGTQDTSTRSPRPASTSSNNSSLRAWSKATY